MIRSIQMVLAFVAILAASTGRAEAGVVTNGSFETGDFSDWGVVDLSDPFSPLLVRPDGFSRGFGLFSTQATDGSLSATHGFDGNGPGTIQIFQDIGVVDPLTDLLTFDYRVGWDMLNFGGSTLDRDLDLNVYEAGSFSTLLGSNDLITLPAGTLNLDTGSLSGSIDLSPFNGQNVRISFDAFVPENFTGPAFFQLDNVQLSAGSGVSPVPEPSTFTIYGIGAVIGLVSTRRRRHEQKRATTA